MEEQKKYTSVAEALRDAYKKNQENDKNDRNKEEQ